MTMMTMISLPVPQVSKSRLRQARQTRIGLLMKHSARRQKRTQSAIKKRLHKRNLVVGLVGGLAVPRKIIFPPQINP
jgi:hypothetical protein